MDFRVRDKQGPGTRDIPPTWAAFVGRMTARKKKATIPSGPLRHLAIRLTIYQ